MDYKIHLIWPRRNLIFTRNRLAHRCTITIITSRIRQIKFRRTIIITFGAVNVNSSQNLPLLMMILIKYLTNKGNRVTPMLWCCDGVPLLARCIIVSNFHKTPRLLIKPAKTMITIVIAKVKAALTQLILSIPSITTYPFEYKKKQPLLIII